MPIKKDPKKKNSRGQNERGKKKKKIVVRSKEVEISGSGGDPEGDDNTKG